MTLVDDNHTDGPRLVFLLAYEHVAKIRKNNESPKSPFQKLQLPENQ